MDFDWLVLSEDNGYNRGQKSSLGEAGTKRNWCEIAAGFGEHGDRWVTAVTRPTAFKRVA